MGLVLKIDTSRHGRHMWDIRLLDYLETVEVCIFCT